MSDAIQKKKSISFSQFSTWYSCEYKWKLDYILKLKKFEDSLNMTFGSAIHNTIQLYLKTLYHKTEKKAESINLHKYFIWSFKRMVLHKKIQASKEELDEFINDGKLILNEFVLPINRRRYFPRDKFELLGIETELKESIVNNLNVVGYLDIVLREKQTGDIKILDFKTSTRGWTSEKTDFTKLAQLRLYKAMYSKKHKIPLNKIQVEFFILKRKTFDETKCKFPQTRLTSFVPSSFKADIEETLGEVTTFINECFTKDGNHIIDKEYRKMPDKKTCKYCQYAKDGNCDKKASPVKL